MVNPDEGRFPEYMYLTEHSHNLTFNPSNGEHNVRVTSPKPGDWFMLAYVNKKVHPDFMEKVIGYRIAGYLNLHLNI